MAKQKTIYICANCGYETAKWLGRCPDCGEWNTLNEEFMQEAPVSKQKAAAVMASTKPAAPVQAISDIGEDDEVRYHTGAAELDRVLGGGLVRGSLVLLGGDPGIGKSTLLLQICDYLCKGQTVLYVSGEESPRQIKLRAKRLQVDSGNLFLLSETDIETIVGTILAKRPDVVMIDSIQTMNLAAVASSPGSVTQVRECTSVLMKVAKNEEISVMIVGHVNKDGAIAGPKVLEHIVDAVLYFEGERNSAYRILRAVKNRFGSTNEIGVFEMSDTGLEEVENPSMALLSGRPMNVSGTCVACVMEGTRPILAEVQALVCKSGFATPRRMSTGFDYNRTSLLIAVLEKRAGFFFGNLDAYINVVGGLRLDEPAADLAVALSLVSGLKDKPVDPHLVAFGEVGLAGELRSVSQLQARVNEAARLGFTRCILPKQGMKGLRTPPSSEIEILAVRNISEALSVLR